MSVTMPEPDRAVLLRREGIVAAIDAVRGRSRLVDIAIAIVVDTVADLNRCDAALTSCRVADFPGTATRRS